MTMRALDLELIERRPSPWAGWALLALALLFAAELSNSYSELERQVQARSTGASTKGERSVGVERGASVNPLEKEAADAAAVIDRLALPWQQLFAALESVAAEQVSLLSVQPDPERRTVALIGEAKQYEDVLAYVERLNKSEAFGRVQLSSHEVREGDPQRPVGFALTASWRLPRE